MANGESLNYAQKLQELEKLLTPTVKIKYLENYHSVEPMGYIYETDAGFDCRAAISENIMLHAMSHSVIPLGFKIEMPSCFEMQIRPRSGLAAKQGITVLNTPGTIDSGYRGEVKAILYNITRHPQIIHPGQRICQAVIKPVTQAVLQTVDTLDIETDRGSGGLGHTGK